MKKAIVTGANGFIGSHLVSELIKNGIEVVAVVRINSDNLPDNQLIRCISCDIKNIRELEALDITADTFYHFAWDGANGNNRFDTELQLKNVQWTIDCLRTAKALGCSRFIGAGTIIEFEAMSAALKQGNKPGISYIYGAGKQASHLMAKSVAASIGIDLIWTYITNTYGEGELSPRLINTTIRKIIADDESFHFTSGTQLYDFIYITDLARAFRLIGERGKPFHEYLIGSNAPRPLRDFLLEMKSILAPDKDFAFGEVPYSGESLTTKHFDASALANDTGFKCEVCFAEGIHRTHAWLRETPKKKQHKESLLSTVITINQIEFNKQFSVLDTFFDVCKLIQPFVAYDNRGVFIKDYSFTLFSQNDTSPPAIKEVFYSQSKPGVIRGMHFQHTRWQTKLVRCIKGKVYDVVVDIRKGSTTYGQWRGSLLSEENNHSLLIPAGFAHGFLSLADSVVSYKCDEVFFAEYDSGIVYNDPRLDIDWDKYWNGEWTISDKDMALQSFDTYAKSVTAFSL